MRKVSKTRQVAEGDLDDDDSEIRERRMPARVRRRFMTDLIEQTAERIPDSVMQSLRTTHCPMLLYPSWVPKT